MLKQSIGIKTFSRIPDLGTGIQIISHIAIAQPYYRQHSHTSITTATYNTEKAWYSAFIFVPGPKTSQFERYTASIHLNSH